MEERLDSEWASLEWSEVYLITSRLNWTQLLLSLQIIGDCIKFKGSKRSGCFIQSVKKKYASHGPMHTYRVVL